MSDFVGAGLVRLKNGLNRMFPPSKPKKFKQFEIIAYLGAECSH